MDVALPFLPRHRSLRIERLAQPVTPYDLLGAYTDQRHVALLENPGEPSPLGRYAYLCTDASLIYSNKRSRCTVCSPTQLLAETSDPLGTLDALIRWSTSSAPSQWHAGLPPFLAGFVGYISYEQLYLIEQIPDLGRDDHPVPDSLLCAFDSVIATDEIEKITWVIASGFGETQEEADRQAAAQLQKTLHRIAHHRPAHRWTREALQLRRAEVLSTRPQLTEPAVVHAGFRPVLSGVEYCELVQRAKEHIFSGDVFEVCTTNRFDTEFRGSSEELYDVLRSLNPSPFASYLRFPEVEALSSSPERFVSLDRERWAETRPIKGTRPRGSTPEEDQALKADLSTAEKDRAENVMIVDLARNDLGRVCEFGTVRVPQMTVVESYAYTHQLVSTVRGRLQPGRNAVDLLRAAFPGGSMTGAPKVEAMKIIDRLEPVKRGVFSGGIGYIDFDGALDLNIVIRTLVRAGDFLSFHVGGAIVADSDPAAEYQETLDKAHPLVTAFEIANRA